MIPAGTRAISFDAVGTLIHPDPPAPAVYAAAGRRYGSRLTEEAIAARFRAAFADEERRDQGRLTTDERREEERWRQIVAAVLGVTDAEACFRELWDHFARPGSWGPADGAGPVLAELARRGYVLGLASNYDARLRPVAAGLPELAPLARLVISSEVGWRKPAGEFFAAVVAAAGAAPDKVLYVGDDPLN